MASVEVTKPNLPNLASGSFMGGPADEVATVDVYSVGKAAVKDASTGIKTLFTSVKELSLEAKEKLEGFLNFPDALGDFISKGKNELEMIIDESALTKRMVETSSDIKSAFMELSDDIKGAARVTMSKETKAKITCAIGDVKTLVSASKIKDAASLGNFINKYTGTSTFNKKDTGAVSALLASVVAKSQDLGISGVYTSLTNTINDNAILRGLTKTLVPIAIAKNYPNLLRQLSGGPYAKIVGLVAPGAVQDFVKNYSLKGNNGARPIKSFDDFLFSVEGMTAGWGKTKRAAGSDDVFDLTDLLGGSHDFKRMVATGVDYYYTSARKSAEHMGSVGHGSIASGMVGAFDGVTTAGGAQVYGVYGLAALYQPVSAASQVRKYFPRVALTGTYDLSVPINKSNASRTLRTSAQQSTMDPRFLNHALASFF